MKPKPRNGTKNGVGAEQLRPFVLVFFESSPPNAKCGTLNNVNTLRLTMVQVASQAKMAISLEMSNIHWGGLKIKYKDSANGTGAAIKKDVCGPVANANDQKRCPLKGRL